jgi:mannose-6-phosphate isomerase
MYPLKFIPIYQERIWGGRNLEKVFGRKIHGDHIGESWDLSSHPKGISIVENGFLAGKNLNEIIAEYKEKLMGKKFANVKSFPLLIKILDANDNLSIQVHPNDECAHTAAGEAGKTEAWYVAHAKEGARIIYGLKNHITKEEFIRAVENNRIVDTVEKLAVKSGDMIFVPAGTVHALLDGVMVYEVQQNSDTTYRIYDYDRIGDDGKPRELHIEKALTAINFAKQPSPVFTNLRIECQHFSMEKLFIAGEIYEKTNDQFVVYCIIEGSGEILYEKAVERLRAGDTVLIPACLENFLIRGHLLLLKIT